MTRVLRTVAILSFAAAMPAIGHAQTPAASPVAVAFMAGAAMPMGDLDDIGNMGFTLGGGVEFGAVMLPFRLRGELGYTRFGEMDASFPDGSGGTVIVKTRPSNLAVTLNAILAPSVPAAQVRPYAIAGIGFYNAKLDASVAGGGFDVSGGDSKGGFGLNGGAGVRFQFIGFSSFIEARYHHMFKGMPDLESEDESWKSAGYLPIVFGISIGG